MLYALQKLLRFILLAVALKVNSARRECRLRRVLLIAQPVTDALQVQDKLSLVQLEPISPELAKLIVYRALLVTTVQ